MSKISLQIDIRSQSSLYDKMTKFVFCISVYLEANQDQIQNTLPTESSFQNIIKL